MTDFEMVWSEARTKVQIRLTGTPVVTSDMGWPVEPFFAQIEYVHQDVEPELDEQVPHWIAVNVKVDGRRILKPRADAVRRLGVDVRDANWSGSWGDPDVQATGSLPEWLDDIVNTLRPCGKLVIPEGK